jgi:hypothetical protein
MNAFLLLLMVTSTLVLRSGDRITVEGAVREENGVITFKSDGVLFSVPSEEVERVELVETDAEGKPVDAAVETEARRRLKVSQEERKRLLEILSHNRGGLAQQKQEVLSNRDAPATKVREARRSRHDESAWRRRARAHEEAVRRAIENLELVENRIRSLETRITSFLALGYRTDQFTYDTTQLVRSREQIPYLRLEVQRAQRAYDEFHDEARREGILPGWLR